MLHFITSGYCTSLQGTKGGPPVAFGEQETRGICGLGQNRRFTTAQRRGIESGWVVASTQFEPRMDFHQDRLVRPVRGSIIRSGKLEITRAIRRASSKVNPPEASFVP